MKAASAWSSDESRAYQLKQLRSTLVRALNHVPYYRTNYASKFSSLAKITDLSAIEALPIIDKTIVRNNHRQFIADDVTIEALTYMTTGGSTGDPLKIMMDDAFNGRTHANTWYYLWTVGFAPEAHLSIRLHGNTIDQELVDQGQFWSWEGKRLTMSVYHIDETTAAVYVQAINAHEPEYIHAYPSALAILCRYIENQNLQVTHTLKWAFVDSETLHPWQKELFQRVLKCEVFSVYGHTEGAGMAITCADCGTMVTPPHVGLMELLRSDGTPALPGEKGEIVVTGFNNDVFPLIRYRTGDHATLAPDHGCWGCQYAGIRLSDIQGRVQDYVVTSSGKPISIAPALFDYNFDWSEIDRFQIFQERPGNLLFRIVVPDSVTDRAQIEQRVVHGFGRILNGQFSIRVSFVEEIPYTPRGKYRYVDQRLPINA
ncbi:MAG: AMP-binding protein [Rhodospirillaceae bacterium]